MKPDEDGISGDEYKGIIDKFYWPTFMAQFGIDEEKKEPEGPPANIDTQICSLAEEGHALYEKTRTEEQESKLKEFIAKWEGNPGFGDEYKRRIREAWKQADASG